MHFNWLHLTDLHIGIHEQKWLWPTVKRQFFDDLARLRGRCAPWDLILFTGDLTNRGTAAEFNRLDETLRELRAEIAALQDGREPLMLAVPGNHDLVRPPDDDDGRASLDAWGSAPSIQEVFWNNPSAATRRTVSTAFAHYSAWWQQ